MLLVVTLGCQVQRSASELEIAAEPADGAQPTMADWIGKRWPYGQINYIIDVDGDFAGKPTTGCTPPYGSLCCYRDGETLGQPVAAMSSGQVDAIHFAIAELEALTPVRFTEYTKDNPPPTSSSYVIYRDGGDGASANIRGMPLDGTPDCIFVASTLTGNQEGRRVMLHETVHMLGNAHEQQRVDRAQYVTYDTQCVMNGGSDKLFNIEEGSLTITPYDYTSVMQYSSANSCDRMNPACVDTTTNKNCLHPPLLKVVTCGTPGCTCAAPNVAPMPGDCDFITTPMELSIHDVNGLNRMYERALGANANNENFGASLATGDFDGDGYDDLAVGVPHEVGGGAVFLYKGTGGADTTKLGRLVAWKVLRRLDGPLTTIDDFGATLATGDFNHDGKLDLAVGAPGSATDGAVYLYLQAPPPNQFSPRRSLVFDRALTQLSITGTAGSLNDQFASALAVGDFNGDGFDDIAIGVPRKVVAGKRSGEVLIRYGNNPPPLYNILTPSNFAGITNIDGEKFGTSLAVDLFNPDADTRADLLVGAPQTSTATVLPGAAYLYLGQSTATMLASQVLAPPDTQRIRFGESFNVGDFDNTLTPGGNRHRELAIGAPYRKVGANDEAGSIFVFKRGTTSYVQVARVEQTTPTAGNRFGSVLYVQATTGNDLLYAGMPDAGPGAIDTLRWSTFSTAPLISTITPPSGITHGFGASIGRAQLLGDSSGYPANVELVVGEPGHNFGAGVVNVRNTDAASMWRVYSQQSANPD